MPNSVVDHNSIVRGGRGQCMAGGWGSEWEGGGGVNRG